MKSRGHVRLLLFFAGLAVAGSALGAFAAEHADGPRGRTIAVVGVVSATCALGFLGVLYHRVKVIKARWEETERYLLRIRRESEKYQAILEGAADMLLLVDPVDGSVLESNAMARTTLGLAAGGAGSAKLVDVVDAEDRARVLDGLRATIAGDGPQAALDEIRLRDKAGKALIVGARLAVIAIEDKRVVQVSLRDLTAQKLIERQLQIHERLSSVGLLTAGVAHEINNPLEAIGNYLSLIERPNLPPEQRARYVESVRHGFARIREIVRDLLQFARPAQGQGAADLAQVVSRALKLVAYSKKLAGIAVETQGLDQPLIVVGDEGRLEQVVVNLVINSATAVGSGGRIRLVAGPGARAGEAAATVELRVEDDGPGIPPGDLERIFDPFFTTTGGTGLGLAVSYGIISAHGGKLAAENREEGGARFTIRLPLRRTDPAGSTAEARR